MTKKNNLGNGPIRYCQFYLGDDCPPHLLSQFPSAKRARDFYNSRQALLKALKLLDRNFKTLEYNQLDIIGHRHLVGHPTTLVSLSHTGNCSAGLVSNDQSIQSIGIDIEKTTRMVRPGVENYIGHPHDQKMSLLELWVAKEACFKAASPIWQTERAAPLVLKDFWVRDSSFGLDHQETPIGHFSLNIERYLDDEFWIAHAWIY